MGMAMEVCSAVLTFATSDRVGVCVCVCVYRGTFRLLLTPPPPPPPPHTHIHYHHHQVPVCVSGLQAVASFINHMESDISSLLSALSQVNHSEGIT